MSTSIRSRVIKIGNSRGIRIPRLLLEQAGLTDEVEMRVEGNRLIIHAAHKARTGWEAKFAAMSEHGDDKLLDEMPVTTWEDEEWEW